MDTKRLQEIKARADAATPGPWELYDNAGGVEVNDGNGTYFSVGNDADAEFIVHARTDIPTLVAEVERLKKALFLACIEIAWRTSSPTTKIAEESREIMSEILNQVQEEQP